MSDLRKKLGAAVARGSQRVASDAPVTVDADEFRDDATGRDTVRVGAPVCGVTRTEIESLVADFEALRKRLEDLQLRLAAGEESSPYALVDQRPAQPELEQLLAVKDVAKLVRVTEKTVREWRSSGLMPEPFELSGTIRWERAQIRDWLDSRRSER